MEFDNKFFEGEVRESFYVEKLVKKVWAAELEVLDEIRKICERHNLTYFAEWGTLLGTVRHNGFIPWDDDIDICMKRPDYMKFMEYAQKELPKDFCLLNIHTDVHYDNMLTRVTNGDTIRFDKEFLERFHGCPFVVGIDIFPLDFIAPDKEADDLMCNLMQLVMQTAYHVSPDEFYGDREEITAYAAQIEQLCNVQFDKKRPLRIQMFLLAEQIGSMYSEEESMEITLMVDHACNMPYYRIPKWCYGKVEYMPFENYNMPVPAGYGTILPIKYGENYMTPVIRNGGHVYPFFKDQKRLIWEKFGCMPDTSIPGTSLT